MYANQWESRGLYQFSVHRNMKIHTYTENAPGSLHLVQQCGHNNYETTGLEQECSKASLCLQDNRIKT